MLTQAAELIRVGADPIDLERVRADTPSTCAVIHFDNAGAAPTPIPVHERVIRHLERERQIGGYAAAREVGEELEGFYSSVAALIGADAREVAFAESATRAWDMLFYSIPFRAGDRILIGRSEYLSNALAMMQMARRRGVTVETVPDGEDGALDVGALAAMLDDRVKLVSVCHIPTSNGLCNDAEGVGDLLRGHPALYLLDACQSVGQIDVDIDRIGCDMLSGTGRKFLRGPRGTGFLYVAGHALDRLDPPFVDMRAARWIDATTYDLRDDARRFESWEYPVASKLGLKVAIDYARAVGIGAIERRVSALAASLRAALRRTAGVDLLDRGTRQSGIVTFRVDGWRASAVRARLEAVGIAVTAIDPQDAPLDLRDDPDAAIVRASVHYFNTDAEIEHLRAEIEIMRPR